MTDDALMTASYADDRSTLLFRLPLELQNRVYDDLWQSNKSVAVVQHSSKIDIRACFEANDVRARHQEFGRHRSYGEAELRPIHARQAQLLQYLQRFQDLSRFHAPIRQHLDHRHLQPTSLLPEWLLISKLFLREAMARFNYKSYWVLVRHQGQGHTYHYPT